MKDWEACYQIGETPWDRGRPAPPLLELLDDRGVDLWLGGPVLVPGCGTGHDVRALADAGVSAHGLDLSPTAVERARALSNSESVSYEVGDFLDPAWRAGRSFPAIWEHTCFCAILPEQRAAYAEAAAALLTPGGVLAGVFFLTPYDPGEDDEGGPPFKVSVEQLDQIFSPWFERIEGWVPQRAYPDREGREWIGIFRRLPQARVADETGCV
jgi:SAM-dependent methyltransferase